MRAGRIYCLKLTLVKSDGSSIIDGEGLKLAGARHEISRELLAAENTSLYELHRIIQQLFGWKNIHLHKFSLLKEDFSRATCGRRKDVYEKLCGVIFRCEDFSGFEWHWHELFRNMVFENMKASGYGIPAAEAYYINQHFIKDENGHLTDGTNNWRNDDKDGDLEDSEHVPEASANILLERLKLCELFLPPGKNETETEARKRPNFKEWIKKLSGRAALTDRKIRRLYKADADFGNKIDRLFKEYRTTEKDFKVLMSIRFHEEKLRQSFGVDYETARNGFKDRFLKLNRDASAMLNDYNPKPEPMFASLFYSYDRGDEWCIRIDCLNAYTRRREKSKGGLWRDALGLAPPILLHLKLEKAIKLKEPLCIYSDGDNLIEEIGGTEGYFDFLKSRAHDGKH